MDKVTFRAVYNRRNEFMPNGTALIQVEAYLKGKKKYFSTQTYVLPEQWDKTAGKIIAHPNKISLNNEIRDRIIELEKIRADRINSGKPFDLNYLADFYSGKINESFIDFVRRNSITEKMNNKTRSSHLGLLKWVEKFKKNVTIDGITFEFLKEFEYFQRSKGLHQNTIVKHAAIIRRYISLAIKKDLLDQNKYPFRFKYTIEKQETHRQYLTPEELERFEAISLQPDKKHLQTSLDKFIFSVYTGLRYGDVHQLKTNSLVTENGNEYLKLIIGKTNQKLKIPIYLPMFNKALDIFYKYASLNNDTVFEFQYNSICNRQLKELAAMAEINKTVTFHVARHTQATCLLYKGVSLTTVQKLLGHKKIETTQIYAKTMDATIKNELEKITSFSV